MRMRNKRKHNTDDRQEPAEKPVARGEGQEADQRLDASREEPGAETPQVELSEDAAEMVRQLQSQRDEAIEGRLRALADFRNYQRRATESEHRAVQTGATRVVRAILPVLDHIDMSLSQRSDQMTLEHLLEAVRIVRDEFKKALAAQGVERIEPAKGEVFDPHRHEAVMRQPAEDAEPDTVVSTLQAGYAMGDIVLRPAKVSVAPPADES